MCARGPSPGSYRGDRVIRGEGVSPTPPIRIRLIAVTWHHDMIRSELSSNHVCQMQGRPTGSFLSEHVHICDMFQKSRTRERVRPGSARIGKVGPFRTVSPFVRGSPDHSSNIQSPEHVRSIPWPSGKWRARRRTDTGHAGRLHSRERAQGRVQPRFRGGGGVEREKGAAAPTGKIGRKTGIS